jgi:hypothetical protein
VLHVLPLLLALIVRKGITPFSELVVSSPVLEGIIADAGGEGSRSSAVIIWLVSVVETLVGFDDGRGFVDMSSVAESKFPECSERKSISLATVPYYVI